MKQEKTIEIRAAVERKASSLPRYVEVDSAALGSWSLTSTTAVEVTLDGVDIGRRNLKKWGRGRDCWFIDLPEVACRKAGVDTGDSVVVVLRRAAADLPEELSTLLSSDASARETWTGLTQSQQRMLADHVRAAKKEETRVSRAEKALRKPDRSSIRR